MKLPLSVALQEAFSFCSLWGSREVSLELLFQPHCPPLAWYLSWDPLYSSKHRCVCPLSQAPRYLVLSGNRDKKPCNHKGLCCVLCDNFESVIYFLFCRYIFVSKPILSSSSHKIDHSLASQEKGVTGARRRSPNHKIIQCINTLRVSKWMQCALLQYSSNRKKNLSQHAVRWSLIFNSVNVY